MSFDLIRRGGPFISDPRKLIRNVGAMASFVRNPSAGAIASNNGSFFAGDGAAVDRIGGSVITTSSYTTDMFKTLLSRSGSGLISNIVGPAASSAQTGTYRITVDGVVFTFTVTLSADEERSVLGWGLPVDAYHANSQYAFSHDVASPDGVTNRINSTSKFLLMGPDDPRVPFLLEYRSSILVETKLSGTATGTSFGSHSAVIGLNTD